MDVLKYTVSKQGNRRTSFSVVVVNDFHTIGLLVYGIIIRDILLVKLPHKTGKQTFKNNL